ncbi:MAG: DUF3078 domain-containing protein [Bacteroidales bacterium]|nr:DUF3078 domain-containing protein [Bacteroidales bacterium]
MKKRVILYLLAILPFFSFAQDDTKKDSAAVADSLKKWKFMGSFSLTTNQASYTNWASGGETAISAGSLFLYNISYINKKSQWENVFKLGYGIVWQKTNGRKKSDDIIDISSKFGYKSYKNWYYSIIAGFNTQFDKGFMSDTIFSSEFMSPGYLSFSIGMDYKPNPSFSLLIAPLAGKFTFVQNETLANAGAYGVKPAVYSEVTGKLITPGETSKSEFGGAIKINYKKEILKNMTLITKLDLFSNYLKSPEKIDIMWDLDINMKVNKYITASISTKLLYDYDIKIGKDENKNEIIETNEIKDRVQFKEVIAVGFTYKF